MGPSTLSTRAPYLGSEIHGPGTQVDSGHTFKLAPAATYLGSEIHGPGTQVDFGRTFKLAPATTIPWVRNPWPRYTS
jgi:hypothetical protein